MYDYEAYLLGIGWQDVMEFLVKHIWHEGRRLAQYGWLVDLRCKVVF